MRHPPPPVANSDCSVDSASRDLGWKSRAGFGRFFFGLGCLEAESGRKRKAAAYGSTGAIKFSLLRSGSRKGLSDLAGIFMLSCQWQMAGFGCVVRFLPSALSRCEFRRQGYRSAERVSECHIDMAFPPISRIGQHTSARTQSNLAFMRGRETRPQDIAQVPRTNLIGATLN